VNLAERESMLMNWPERVWIYSPVRVFFQRREVREWLRVAPPKMLGSALEIGCGLGRGARLATDLMGFESVVAFDLEEILVQRSIRLRPADYRERVSFHVADAQDLPYPDAAFDAVINFGIIHHVLDWRKCLREISRVLKQGGIFYFEEIYPPLYANPLFKLMLRHPRSDRFYGKDFLCMLSEVGLRLAPGVKTGSKFGIVGAAVKD
jgi:ubiquinone/menaquinone biosynthesis C-methylase UbiE